MESKDTRVRCSWAGTGNMLAYHDTEWGVPVHDDAKHFEFLILEGAQAGLSWQTILNRRDGYREAFANFDPAIVAHFSDGDMDRLLNDAGIIRNRLKIKAAVANARVFCAIQSAFGSFDAYIWQFVDGKPVVNAWEELEQCPAETPISAALSTDLKKRGCTFVGPVVCYSHLQAAGLVQDHWVRCFRWEELGGRLAGSA